MLHLVCKFRWASKFFRMGYVPFSVDVPLVTTRFMFIALYFCCIVHCIAYLVVFFAVLVNKLVPCGYPLKKCFRHLDFTITIICLQLYKRELHCINSYYTLHCFALFCIALYCSVLCCIVLPCAALHCIILHCIESDCLFQTYIGVVVAIQLTLSYHLLQSLISNQ